MSPRRNTFICYIASISGDIAVGAVAYQEHTGLVMQPLVLEADGYSASLDGMTLDGDLVLEIKCPLRGTRSDLWHDVQSGQVPTHYGIQVQHQLMVSGAALAHLWVFDGNQGILHAIEPDATVMEQIQAGWDDFEQYLNPTVFGAVGAQTRGGPDLGSF